MNRVFDVLLEVNGDKCLASAYCADAVAAIQQVKELTESRAAYPWSAVTVVAVMPATAAETLKGAVRESIWTPKPEEGN